MAEPPQFLWQSLHPRLERAVPFATDKFARRSKSPNFFPMYTVNGHWNHTGESWTDWCAGFHAGMMWLIAQKTGEPWWREQAEHYFTTGAPAARPKRA